jgi:hypothetical protein
VKVCGIGIAIAIVIAGLFAFQREQAKSARIAQVDNLGTVLIHAYRHIDERLPRGEAWRNYERVTNSDFAKYCGFKVGVIPEEYLDRKNIEETYIGAVRTRDEEVRKQLVAALPQYISQSFLWSIDRHTGVLEVSVTVDSQQPPVSAAILIDSTPQGRITGDERGRRPTCGPK